MATRDEILKAAGEEISYTELTIEAVIDFLIKNDLLTVDPQFPTPRRVLNGRRRDGDDAR